jgi:hypothetical protein
MVQEIQKLLPFYRITTHRQHSSDRTGERNQCIHHTPANFLFLVVANEEKERDDRILTTIV